ncbi:MAG: WYL domain-containing protein [Actinobacteria bacterium]|jgi:proteasome accessory factor B|nr:WYL domain-containing protein [Actinomycetota bacterium]
MSAPTGPAAKTERLLNLVLVLLYTRRPLTKARIRQMVPQYASAPTDEAFDRTFERDKDELRELGIPLVTEEVSAGWDDDQGYRIDQREYALPDLTFERDELAVLGLASRAWAQASLGSAAAQALRKLRAADVERDEESLIGIEPRLRTTEPSFDALKDAALRRVPVTFEYRRPDSDDTMTRQVQPWRVLLWHGRWYLTGFDLDRQAPRVFRLSRIAGSVRTAGRPGSFEVPADHDPHLMVSRSTTPTQHSPAILRVRSGRGHLLRRRARSVGEVDDQWSLVDIDYSDVDEFAGEVAAHGADVVVEQPHDLRQAVIARLRAALGEGSTAGEGEAR